ncbi:hypothetical protein [Nostoc parmelioides]|uniref:Uncharacterized protein n=1 Tax=Nostoc parmelioides FACHB-3921 TaxID=2692909 RepID=A0ABR8BPN5_9NOSO|nr:hypothetical protein [Nostoc parmelioides]MBD2255906.1 hypothetical protein [Nostoc parmelioides FACHB-3921]
MFNHTSHFFPFNWLSSLNSSYKDLGVDYFDKQQPESVKKRLIKRLEKLGYQVSIEPIPVAI